MANLGETYRYTQHGNHLEHQWKSDSHHLESMKFSRYKRLLKKTAHPGALKKPSSTISRSRLTPLGDLGIRVFSGFPERLMTHQHGFHGSPISTLVVNHVQLRFKQRLNWWDAASWNGDLQPVYCCRICRYLLTKSPSMKRESEANQGFVWSISYYLLGRSGFWSLKTARIDKSLPYWPCARSGKFNNLSGDTPQYTTWRTTIIVLPSGSSIQLSCI